MSFVDSLLRLVRLADHVLLFLVGLRLRLGGCSGSGLGGGQCLGGGLPRFGVRFFEGPLRILERLVSFLLRLAGMGQCGLCRLLVLEQVITLLHRIDHRLRYLVLSLDQVRIL